jgi:iron uptake system component EfeO
VRRAALAIAAASVPTASACGGSGDGSSAPKGAQTVKISLSDAGCDPAKVDGKAGVFHFVISNSGSSKVTELELVDRKNIILGERENIVPGISGAFSLTLQPGTYTLACTNGDMTPKAVLRVSGHPVAAPGGPTAALLQTATAGYQSYVIGEAANLRAATSEFVSALRVGNVQKAKALFGPTRLHYEAIEPVAESFGPLDPEIDARVNDVADTSSWTGFHRIEQILWVQNTTRGTGIYATKLLADVTTLYTRVQTLTYQPAQLANGAVELLNEVAPVGRRGQDPGRADRDVGPLVARRPGGDDRPGQMSGAPLGRTAEHDPVDLSARKPDGDPRIPLDAHIRLASHATNGGVRILRRGYNYTDGMDPATGELDAGLFFIAFQRDPHAQFAVLQRRLGAGDALNEYIKHTSSAVFAIPAGLAPGRYVAQGLFT